jgi:phosphatidate cytidylyltransferase
MHWQRWLTSIIAVPILLLILLKGSRLSFALLILAASVLAHWEYLAMIGIKDDWHQKTLGVGVGAILIWSFGAADVKWTMFIMVLILFTYFFFFLINFDHFPALLPELGLSCLGIVYVPFLMGHFIWLRVLPQGEYWVLWLLLLIFAGDTGAFYSGRWFGVRKLCPAVSPGKTVAGAIGGLLSSLTVGVVVGRLFLVEINFLVLLFLSLLLALIGQLGDLFESMLKRRAQIKDSSGILPGHGGLLDRLDSLLFTVPVFYHLWVLCIK